ncbi:MAG: transporter substrate-binding domain-containing protein, partial [Pseudomonadota bacterium]
MQADRFPRALATALAALLFASPLPVSASEAAASGGAEVEAEAGGDETGVSDAALMTLAREPFQGDLDGIVNRGFLRIGTVHSPILLSYDGAEQTGMAVDLAEELEKHLRQTIGKPAATLNVVLLPLTRDALIPALLDGRVDMLAANLTVTPARAERIAFTDPMLTEVSEVVVTGPGLGPVSDLEALVPQGVALRPTSSYASSLEALNAAREAEGKPLIPLKPLDERLEDHDAIELVIDGAAAATVVDSHKATLWAEVFPEAHV